MVHQILNKVRCFPEPKLMSSCVLFCQAGSSKHKDIQFTVKWSSNQRVVIVWFYKWLKLLIDYQNSFETSNRLNDYMIERKLIGDYLENLQLFFPLHPNITDIFALWSVFLWWYDDNIWIWQHWSSAAFITFHETCSPCQILSTFGEDIFTFTFKQIEVEKQASSKQPVQHHGGESTWLNLK